MKLTAMTAAIVLAAMIGGTGSASAGKETFHRDKPHVNIGTIGHVEPKNAQKQKSDDDQATLQFRIQVGTSKMQNAQ